MPTKVLMIVTSHDRVPVSERPTGFWLEGFAAPYYVFADAGIEVMLASPRGGQPPVDPRSERDMAMTEATRRFMADHIAQKCLERTVPLSTVDGDGIDALLIADGDGATYDLATDADAQTLARDFSAMGKPMAVVGRGAAAFVDVIRPDGRPLVEGRRLTAFSDAETALSTESDDAQPLVETELRARGARFTAGAAFEPHAMIDGLIVSGQNPASSEAAARLLLDLLERRLAA
ncbi:MAG: type 1 glutamine amidotransferase domain-containing protein [Pseudomonadota bacterium]